MTKRNHKRIAILGSRGIPAEFGGFETFAEQLAVRLVKHGWDVTVFCERSQSYGAPEYKGVRLKYLYAPDIVGLRSIWFDILSVLKTLRGYDIVYMLGYHAAFAFPLPKLFGVNFWVNMDGLEWQRSKWSVSAQRYLRTMERVAARFSSHIVADAQGIADYLSNDYPETAEKTYVIQYGAFPVDNPPDSAPLIAYDLQPQGYYLIICRLEPENHVREIIEGFVRSNSNRRLLVVGDHSTGTPYIQSLHDVANEQVVFLGTVFDRRKLTTLRYHCYAYLHGHSVGGTNPSLLEAMACGNYVIAHDNVFNREVTKNICSYFTTPNDLKQILRKIEHDGIPRGVSDQLKRRITDRYNWENITNRYESVFRKSCGPRE